MTSSIIQSGLLPLLRNASITRRRLAAFLRLASEVAVAISVRRFRASTTGSMRLRSSLIASAPMPAVKASGPSSSRSCS